MKIYGHVAAPPEHKTNKQGGHYCTFRMAENYGKDDHRISVWFDVNASIDPLDAELIERGQCVEIDGRLDPEAYLKKRALEGVPVPTSWEEVAKLLKARNALGVGLKVLTMSVKPHVFEKREQAASPRTVPAPNVTAPASTGPAASTTAQPYQAPTAGTQASAPF